MTNADRDPRHIPAHEDQPRETWPINERVADVESQLSDLADSHTRILGDARSRLDAVEQRLSHLETTVARLVQAGDNT